MMDGTGMDWLHKIADNAVAAAMGLMSGSLLTLLTRAPRKDVSNLQAATAEAMAKLQLHVEATQQEAKLQSSAVSTALELRIRALEQDTGSLRVEVGKVNTKLDGLHEDIGYIRRMLERGSRRDTNE